MPRSAEVALPAVSIYGGAGGLVLPERMKVRRRRVYCVRNATVLPRHIVLLNGWTTRVARWSFLARKNFRHPALSTANGDVWPTDPIARDKAMVVEGPVLLADTTHYDYGHVLLEIAPRLDYLKYCPPETRVLTSLKLGPTYEAMFAAMGVDKSRVISFEGPVHCDELYFGDSLVDIFSFMAPEAWSIFERIGKLAEQSQAETFSRIYVSRRGVSRRPLANEAAVEDLFRSLGFAVIRPETMSFADQVRIFAAAEMIAGPRGSGMHNVVFSSPDARVLLMTYERLMLNIDTFLTRKEGTLAYVIGRETEAHPNGSPYYSTWEVDLKRVREAAVLHFGLQEEVRLQS